MMALVPNSSARADRLWFHLGSKHWDGGDYNEVNPGLGYQLDLTGRLALEAGTYENSHKQPSRYVFGSYKFHQRRGWRFRIFGGFADRYHGRKLENGEGVPMAGVTVEYHWGRVLNIPGVSAGSIGPELPDLLRSEEWHAYQ